MLKRYNTAQASTCRVDRNLSHCLGLSGAEDSTTSQPFSWKMQSRHRRTKQIRSHISVVKWTAATESSANVDEEERKWGKLTYQQALLRSSRSLLPTYPLPTFYPFETASAQNLRSAQASAALQMTFSKMKIQSSSAISPQLEDFEVPEAFFRYKTRLATR